MSRIQEGNMYALNAPGYRGHFVILVRVETPWLYFYDTVDKVYFMTSVSDLKRAEKLIAHSPDGRHKLPYVDFVQTIPDKIWFPLESYCESVMKTKPMKQRNFVKNL